MIRTVFEWREDQEHGGYGWIPKGFPDFNVSNGLGVAHDTIEHFKATGALLTDEMLAFGSILYTRVESGWFYQMKHNPAASYHMGSDIGIFLMRHRNDPDFYKLTNPGVTRLLDDEMEDEITAVIVEGIRSANAELVFGDNGENFEANYVTEWMKSWMRRGYRKAIKRWKGNASHEMSYLFDRIVEQIDSDYKNGEEGEELHVGINPTTLELVMRRQYSYH